MDNYSIKSVMFGGFDKQDVIQYIEQSSQKASAAQTELQDENEKLQSQLAALTADTEALRSENQFLNAQLAQLKSELELERAVRMELEALKPLSDEVGRLQTEIESLKPDAQAYAQFRGRIGAIECEARERAATLEKNTIQQLQHTVDLFRAQYQILMSTFETTANHVNSELRKVEVNLTQLPRAMDQAGNELNELAAQLDRSKNEL